MGPGDMTIRDLDESERGARVCPECDSLYANEEGRANLCHGCADRLRPLCICGCEEEATLVADLYVDGEHDCRAPWLSIEHALDAVDSTDPSAHVDVRPLDPLAEILKAAPCWCSMGVEWCPDHGKRF